MQYGRQYQAYKTIDAVDGDHGHISQKEFEQVGIDQIYSPLSFKGTENNS